MWILAGNLYAKLQKSTEAERHFVQDYLTFVDANARFKNGDQTTCLLNLFNETFPSGLVGMVKKAALAAGHQVKVIDQRTRPVQPDPNADLAWLRDYQQEAVGAIVKNSRGIIWVPTGGGKGEIVIGLTRAMPCNWLFIVHRGNLVNDIAARYEKHNPGREAGRIGDGTWTVADPEQGVGTLTCATFQTLAANMKKPRFKALVKSAEAVVIDEAHTLPAQSFWKVAMALKETYYRVAMSGTPLARGDRRSLFTIAATGPVVYRVRTETLVKRGILARPKIRMLRCYQESDKPTWQGAYGELVVRSTQRNRLLVDAAKKASRPTLVFVKEIKHGKKLRERMEKAGLKADFVWGSDSQSTRDYSVKRLVRGDTDVLICSVVFQEGVDIPELASVIIAAGGKSIIATLQRIGRGMRSNAGKKQEFEVVDVLDVGNQWTEKHARMRKSSYLKEGHEVAIVTTTPGKIAESKARLNGAA